MAYSASAIANAVSNAIGVRITSLPITPDKVLAALGKIPGGAKNHHDDIRTGWMAIERPERLACTSVRSWTSPAS